MLEIMRALRQCFASGRKAVLATIVSVDGSTYRREGVRCVILDDGKIIGVVSGGCVESDLAEHAQSVLDTGVPKQVSYDFRGEEDLLWGLGLGCNGALTLLLQCFDPVHSKGDAEDLLNAFERRLQTQEVFTVATVVSSDDPVRLPPGKVFDVPDTVAAFETETAMVDTVVDDVKAQLFVERINPRWRLIVFGAGPDAMPVVRLGGFLQWRVTVVDHRPSLVDQARFPDADEVLQVTRKSYRDVLTDSHTVAVVMTHHYEVDKLLIESLLNSPTHYVGALGPRKRTDKILSELADEGVYFSQPQLDKLFAPIGLDVGAESPEEIALAIVTEALARQNGRNAGSLRHHDGPLHKRSGSTFVTAPEGIHPGVCGT